MIQVFDLQAPFAPQCHKVARRSKPAPMGGASALEHPSSAVAANAANSNEIAVGAARKVGKDLVAQSAIQVGWGGYKKSPELSEGVQLQVSHD
jgi:hypothetical protein